MNLKWLLTLPGSLLVSGSDASARRLGWNLAEQGDGTCFYGVIAVLATMHLPVYSALVTFGLFAESVAKADAKQFSPNFRA